MPTELLIAAVAALVAALAVRVGLWPRWRRRAAGAPGSAASERERTTESLAALLWIVVLGVMIAAIAAAW